MEANDSVDVLVRRRLRELRMQRGLTLEDVAQAARIDVSTLSRLESGKRRLALDHLPRLAAALSVSTDELVREPVAEDPRVRGRSQTRHGVTYWPLKRVRVTLRHSRIHAKDCADCETSSGWIDHIDRDVELAGDLDDTQRQRLLHIVERCPVHQTLTSEVDVATSLV